MFQHSPAADLTLEQAEVQELHDVLLRSRRSRDITDTEHLRGSTGYLASSAGKAGEPDLQLHRRRVGISTGEAGNCQHERADNKAALDRAC